MPTRNLPALVIVDLSVSEHVDGGFSDVDVIRAPVDAWWSDFRDFWVRGGVRTFHISDAASLSIVSGGSFGCVTGGDRFLRTLDLVNNSVGVDSRVHRGRVRFLGMVGNQWVARGEGRQTHDISIVVVGD